MAEYKPAANAAGQTPAPQAQDPLAALLNPNSGAPSALPRTPKTISLLPNVTNARLYTIMCPRPVQEMPPNTPELKPWDGKPTKSPVEQYLDNARGGLDPVRGEQWGYQVAQSLPEAALNEVGGLLLGKVAGQIAKIGAPVIEKAAISLANTARKIKGNGVFILRGGRVSTKPNTAFFWSDRSKDASGKVHGGADDAARLAKERGGTTLETIIEERNIKMPNWDPNDPSSIRAWEDISAEYARGASGDVRAVIGSELRPGNVWETRELPALMRNPNVTSITTIDPATGAMRQIYP